VKEKPEDILRVKLDFSLTNPPENKIVISAGNLSFSYGSRKIFQNADFKVYNGSKTALWGENGVGKTTLLNLISHKASDSIYIVPKARIGYLCQEFENLDSSRTVLENVMQESVQSQAVARTILARLLMSGDDVYKKVGVLSGGEKIKVSFAKLFVSDSNVLLLDEPTNYLDMASMEALEGVLCDYEGTVVFVSHDETFVNTVADRLLVFENLTVRDFEGSLQELRQNRLKGKKEDVNETERIALQMRITEIVSKLSNPGEDKETLEAEYKRLISLIK
jgi:macrolide transport system ATP-binding/permease protein